MTSKDNTDRPKDPRSVLRRLFSVNFGGRKSSLLYPVHSERYGRRRQTYSRRVFETAWPCEALRRLSVSLLSRASGFPLGIIR